MTCTKPILLFKGVGKGSNPMSKDPTLRDYLEIPCKKCIACKISYSAEWCARIYFHMSNNKDSFFLTLTYDENNVPVTGRAGDKILTDTLLKSDVQKFLKRLRKAIKPNSFKYYMAGEYGEKNGRPHYHLIILDWRPDDIKVCRVTKRKTSPTIAKCWSLGHHDIGDVTKESIQYVTGYLKKSDTRKLLPTQQIPYSISSKGIGKEFGLENLDKILENKITLNGHKITVPRYYKEMATEEQKLLQLTKKSKQEIAADRRHGNWANKQEAREQDRKVREANLTVLKKQRKL